MLRRAHRLVHRLPEVHGQEGLLPCPSGCLHAEVRWLPPPPPLRGHVADGRGRRVLAVAPARRHHRRRTQRRSRGRDRAPGRQRGGVGGGPPGLREVCRRDAEAHRWQPRLARQRGGGQGEVQAVAEFGALVHGGRHDGLGFEGRSLPLEELAACGGASTPGRHQGCLEGQLEPGRAERAGQEPGHGEGLHGLHGESLQVPLQVDLLVAPRLLPPPQEREHRAGSDRHEASGVLW
mmetsp:Transcript_123774/g.396132  ORF Transcript_123774/g.396132 Transcript_123774/m.396132 type:complete len:235 (+) Transcript_123774:3630-4334(+)